MVARRPGDRGVVKWASFGSSCLDHYIVPRRILSMRSATSPIVSTAVLAA